MPTDALYFFTIIWRFSPAFGKAVPARECAKCYVSFFMPAFLPPILYALSSLASGIYFGFVPSGVSNIMGRNFHSLPCVDVGCCILPCGLSCHRVFVGAGFEGRQVNQHAAGKKRVSVWWGGAPGVCISSRGLIKNIASRVFGSSWLGLARLG